MTPNSKKHWPEQFSSLISTVGSMARYWTDLARECYQRKCRCSGCYYETFFESNQKCQMWRTVYILTRDPQYNRPDGWISPDPFYDDDLREGVDFCHSGANSPLLDYLDSNNMRIFKTSDIPSSLWTEQTTRKHIQKLIAEGLIRKISVRKRTYYKLCQI